MNRLGKARVFILAAIVLGSFSIPAFAGDAEHRWFFPNHPRMRRVLKAAGFGVATGGLAAPLLGTTAATGAVLGAGEHAAVRGVKDQRDIKHHKKLDHHFW
ncbi:MAG: hypothetical protein K2X81_14945 [Candidatus Obscuribacterales bacterium]|nr:hypothetical protein [Candidatus Obscuribacterales bacterium]